MTAVTRSSNLPAYRGFAITPSDADLLTKEVRGIWVGAAGAVKVDTVGGDTLTFSGALAGTIIPIRAKKVYAAGTTATGLIGLY